MATCINCSSAATKVLVALLIARHLLGHYILLNPQFRSAFAQQLQSTMPLGSSWPATSLSYIPSPAKTFCFGWLQFPSGSRHFYVAVRYCALDNAIVWVANRDTPAAANDTLQLTPDGNLLIARLGTVQSSSAIWQTHTSSKGVYSLQVHDSGNVQLLLHNASSSSNESTLYAWQSFSCPTDTLLPTQSFLVNQTLISRPPAYSTSLGSGNFMFYIIEGLAYIDNIDSFGHAITVWQSWPRLSMTVEASTSSVIAGQFMEMGVFFLFHSNGTAYSQLISSDYGVTTSSNGDLQYRRLTLDPDGDLRMYAWNYTSGTWGALLEVISSHLCSTMARKRVAPCGPYGVCVDAPEPACACPPGFHPTSRGDVSQGCSPDNNLPLPSCQNASNVYTSTVLTYVVMHNTDYMGNDITLSGISGIALGDCETMCTEKCSCVGFIYDQSGSATCWLKTSIMNGYSPRYQRGTRDAFIKVYNSTASPIINPASQSPTLAWINSSAFWSQASLQPTILPCTSCTSSCPPALFNNSRSPPPHKAHTLVLTASLISVGEILCFLLVLFLLQKTNTFWHQPLTPSPMDHPGCQAFSFAELVQATENFRQPLGSGGFGEVFKGILRDGREIAVKRLKISALQLSDTHDQFRAEIATLGRVHHMNLVRLYGYCAEDSHRLLVYEFMKNGAMNRFLFAEEVGDQISGGQQRRGRLLDWRTRYNICLGMARGLAYLHEDCLDCIVHCDIKPENILLDNEFCAKVADFGLAYLFGRNETLETSTIRGTRGYLAPEWLSYLPITGKADVFSYGMLLIEIVSGRKNFRHTTVDDKNTVILMHPSWAFRQVQSGHVKEVVDPSIRGAVDYGEVEKVLRIAFLCLHQEATARPSMKSIVQMLEGTIKLPILPYGPGSFQHQVETGFDLHPTEIGRQGPRLINNTTNPSSNNCNTTTNPSSSSVISARETYHVQL